MSAIKTDECFSKFRALDKEKQERIINAAMKEFAVGYKNASTDNIVKEAGISKGLLFHYFGTKAQLYNYLVGHAVDTVRREYSNLSDVVQPDVLKSVWQLSVLKGELSRRYPAIFDFAANAYVDKTAPDNSSLLTSLGETQADIMVQIYAKADYSLFREDIDPEKAISILMWTMEGYAHSVVKVYEGEQLGSTPRDNYGEYLKDFKDIVETLRKCFYK